MIYREVLSKDGNSHYKVNYGKALRNHAQGSWLTQSKEAIKKYTIDARVDMPKKVKPPQRT